MLTLIDIYLQDMDILYLGYIIPTGEKVKRIKVSFCLLIVISLCMYVCKYVYKL